MGGRQDGLRDGMHTLRWQAPTHTIGWAETCRLAHSKVGVFYNILQNAGFEPKEGWLPVVDGMKSVCEITQTSGQDLMATLKTISECRFGGWEGQMVLQAQWRQEGAPETIPYHQREAAGLKSAKKREIWSTGSTASGCKCYGDNCGAKAPASRARKGGGPNARDKRQKNKLAYTSKRKQGAASSTASATRPENHDGSSNQ